MSDHTDHPPAAGMHGRAWGRREALEALESPLRRATQDPEALWDHVGLRPGAVVADIGAGTGYFALPAARRVGARGHVYAVDLSAELVELLRERASAEGFGQLEAVRSTTSRIPLPSAIADVVLLANVLHDIPEATVTEAVRLMRPEGQLVNLDWKKEETPGGPPVSVRLTPEAAGLRLARAGLRVVDRWSLGPHHYVLTCLRPVV